MPQTDNDGTAISRAKAKPMIQAFQGSQTYKDQKIKGGFYGKKKLLAILNQTDCIGIRYYFALNSAAEPVIVLVGEDSAGKSLSDGTLINEGPQCPPYCPTSNALDA